LYALYAAYGSLQHQTCTPGNCTAATIGTALKVFNLCTSTEMQQHTWRNNVAAIHALQADHSVLPVATILLLDIASSQKMPWNLCASGF
jgi:hypothetical protein